MTKLSDQTQDSPQITGNGMLPYSLQRIKQRMRQTFSKRSISEGSVVPNMPRNNDDEEFDGNNNPTKPPPITTSFSEPIVRNFKGNLTKFDNSKHETNVSCNNVKNNVIKDSFNNDYDPREGKICCHFYFRLRQVTLIYISNLGKEPEPGSNQQVISTRKFKLFGK